MGRPNYLHYVSSKAGVQGLTRAMAREVGDFDITVNAILPGATVTEVPRETVSPEQMKAMIQARCIKRPQEVSDLTGLVGFLCSDEAGFITGQSFVVDGGLVVTDHQGPRWDRFSIGLMHNKRTSYTFFDNFLGSGSLATIWSAVSEFSRRKLFKALGRFCEIKCL